MFLVRKYKFIFLTFLLLISNSKLTVGFENKILLKVENEIVTTIDIYDEIKFLKAFNPESINLNQEELIEISKNSIIKEKIKKIEILKFVKEIKVDEKFLLRFIQNKYAKIGLNSLESFNEYIEKNDLNINVVKEKIATELIWNDMILQKFKSKVVIDKKKIRDEILKTPQKKTQREILISEIVFSVNKKSDYEKKYEKIISDIERTNFQNAATINSESDTASNGGSIGWVKEDNLNKIIREKILNLKIGQISQPIRTSSGFIILKIEDKKEYELKFDLDKKVSELIRFKTNEQLNQFSNMYFNKLKKNMRLYDL